MTPSEATGREPSRRVRVPRWAGPFPWIIGALAVHVALPWAISLATPRYGWVEGHPGLWNWIALTLVAAGLAMIAWGASLHLLAAAGGWELERTPPYLLVRGPYRFSRNPMYLFVLVMWLGWASFYGGIALLAALFLWWLVFAFLLVPYEERQLEARFGETYLQYKKAVPRWFRLRRR